MASYSILSDFLCLELFLRSPLLCQPIYKKRGELCWYHLKAPLLLTYVLYLGINQRNHQVFKSSYYLSTLKFLCKERCVFCSSISTGTKNEATNSFCFLKNNERGLLLQDEEGKSERERFLALSKVTWQVVKCKRKFHTPVTACFGGGCNGGKWIQLMMFPCFIVIQHHWLKWPPACRRQEGSETGGLDGKGNKENEVFGMLKGEIWGQGSVRTVSNTKLLPGFIYLFIFAFWRCPG